MERTFPGGRLYGPYHHGGRHYFQWMARGSYLRDHLLPMLEAGLSPELDAPSLERFVEMKQRYSSRLRTAVPEADPDPG
ncbi:MAG TPA: hypothetical protein VII76_14445 [Acidimicrobiales bacterium]